MESTRVKRVEKEKKFPHVEISHEYLHYITMPVSSDKILHNGIFFRAIYSITGGQTG